MEVEVPMFTCSDRECLRVFTRNDCDCECLRVCSRVMIASVCACVPQTPRGGVQYGNVNYNVYMPGYVRIRVFVTNCYNFLHFNLFYVNFTHGLRRIVLLFLM